MAAPWALIATSLLVDIGQVFLHLSEFLIVTWALFENSKLFEDLPGIFIFSQLLYTSCNKDGLVMLGIELYDFVVFHKGHLVHVKIIEGLTLVLVIDGELGLVLKQDVPRAGNWSHQRVGDDVVNVLCRPSW